jgi:CheY-like chemotaxis protein
MAAQMRTPQSKLIAVVIFGIIGIIVIGNAAGAWFLTRGATGAIKDFAPVIVLICVITPLISATAAFFVVRFFKHSHEKLKKVPFDLHELFTDCRTLIAPKAAEKGIILHFYAEPAISKMPLGDPDRLRQALVNLLSNAVKYTNTGMVKLHSAIKERHSGGWLPAGSWLPPGKPRDKTITISFEVKDSGVGMTGEQIEKLRRAHTYETRDSIEMMGGKLMIESTPGLGSKFSFELTFDTIDVSDDDIAGKDGVIDEFEMPVFEGEILLCEDSTLNQQIICEHLTRVGIKTAVANNGRIGVDMVQNRLKEGKKPFDLIFMDIHMPVMDGLEAASAILDLGTGSPIVAMTANIMSNDLEIYRVNGIYDYVGKPFTSQELWRALSKYFKPVSRQAVTQDRRIQVENEIRKKLIIHFVKDNRNKIAEITDAISANDIKLARLLAHSLKSSAAQVGKILLQQAALEVEQRLKEEQSRVTPQQMAVLEAELKAALAELAPLAQEFSNNGEKDIKDA